MKFETKYYEQLFCQMVVLCSGDHQISINSKMLLIIIGSKQFSVLRFSLKFRSMDPTYHYQALDDNVGLKPGEKKSVNYVDFSSYSFLITFVSMYYLIILLNYQRKRYYLYFLSKI